MVGSGHGHSNHTPVYSHARLCPPGRSGRHYHHFGFVPGPHYIPVLAHPNSKTMKQKFELTPVGDDWVAVDRNAEIDLYSIYVQEDATNGWLIRQYMGGASPKSDLANKIIFSPDPSHNVPTFKIEEDVEELLRKSWDEIENKYGTHPFHLSTFYTHKDRKSTRLNSSHIQKSRMPSSA